jgi:prephenate dehydrogenase
LFLKDLRNISIIGLGLLGGSISLATQQRLSGVTVIGYSHRARTRKKARELAVAAEIVSTLEAAVVDADLVILATPIFTFADYFAQLRDLVKPGCVITDVGSTKVLPHRWAEACLNQRIRYVGSHPIAGSEQRGVEFARDDLLAQARCILTTTQHTSRRAVRVLKDFWRALGCFVETMPPEEHDRVYADVSHLPHLIAAALVNASDRNDMKFAGKGFLDSTRIASGAATIWTDILLANTDNLTQGIDRVLAELSKLRRAIENQDQDAIEALLDEARRKRAALVKYKIQMKELLS